jgi:hypothetical protein
VRVVVVPFAMAGDVIVGDAAHLRVSRTIRSRPTGGRA